MLLCLQRLREGEGGGKLRGEQRVVAGRLAGCPDPCLVGCLSGCPSGWLAGELSPDCLLAICRPTLLSISHARKERRGERERERDREIARVREIERERVKSEREREIDPRR